MKINLLPICYCLLLATTPAVHAEDANPPLVESSLLSIVDDISYLEQKIAIMKSLPEDDLFLYLTFSADYIIEFRIIHFNNRDAKLMIDRSRREGLDENSREFKMYVEQYEGGIKRMRELAKEIIHSKEINLEIRKRSLNSTLKKLGLTDRIKIEEQPAP